MISEAVGRLPVASERRLAVRLTPDALRHVRSGHPWVFDESIVSVSHEAQAGDLAVVFDADRKFAAIGLYDPDSPIALKILHNGKPVTIDATWWRERLELALAGRGALARSDKTTAFRCINGENDGFPGLVLDRYDTTYVLKLYSAAWLPHLRTLVPVFDEVLTPTSLVVRLSRVLRSTGGRGGQWVGDEDSTADEFDDARLVPQGVSAFGPPEAGTRVVDVALPETPIHRLKDGDVLAGVTPDRPVMFLEHGLVFEADVEHGQKTGHFLDQRDNRAMLRGMVDSADVLDVFCATGGFSVYAAAGGAKSVHSVDIAPSAIDATIRNMAHNKDRPTVAACTHQWTVGDAFEVMERLRRQKKQYDVVIIDPPSFAQKQSSIEGAVRAYRRLTMLGIALLRPGGLLVQASCSSRVPTSLFYQTVVLTAGEQGVRFDELARTGHPVDHPATFTEGQYLKAVFARVRPNRAVPQAAQP
jgi:23S rRNA (cytosine1962-C5)-methyltransferase